MQFLEIAPHLPQSWLFWRPSPKVAAHVAHPLIRLRPRVDCRRWTGKPATHCEWHCSTYTHLSRFSSPHHPWFALVPHCLCEMGVMVTYQIEAQHINVCLELLRRFGAEGGCFLSRIVTVVETWVDYIERETKWTSKEWSFSRRRSRRSLVRINLQGRLC